MKAARKSPFVKFIPVVLTLTSQAEVDSVFALFNHVDVIDPFPALSTAYEVLLPYASQGNRVDNNNAINNNMKKKFGGNK